MLQRFCDAYAKLLSRLMTVLMLVLLLAMTIQIAGRYIPFIPPWLWPLEVTNFALIWLIFIGSVMGVRTGRHFMVDVFQGKKLSPATEVVLRVIYYVVMFTVTLIFVTSGYQYFLKWGVIQTSDIIGINLGFLYASVPLAGLSWALFLIDNLIKDLSVASARKKGG